MKKILSILLAAGLLTACSTTKNTQATRGFHAMKVRYNIFYNGNQAYIEGLQAIQKAHTDDFTQIVPLYPVSDHKAAEAATSNMDLTIEKCRKAIKLHSIKAKPKPNPKKRRDPEYKKWLEQEEFNKAMPDVWVRLGEAEFHKGDFIGSIGTFTYVIRHFNYDPVTVARCQLMMARAYAELGWTYEAEDWLNKTSADALPRKYAPLYAAANADVLMKSGNYKEALPYIKIALPAEKRKVYRPRFQYAMAQLYEQAGQRNEAINSYRKVIRMAPPTDMDFNARIHRAKLQGKSAIKQLNSMAKQAKYKDRLDQLYGTIGHIYLNQKDTAKALEYYNLAIEKSTKAEMPKAEILVKAADIYFDRQNYQPAQPYYQEAITIIPVENGDFNRIARRSEALDDLVREYGTITLQDSLQYLSTLSEEEQLKAAEREVERVIAAEQRAEEEALIAARAAEEEGLSSVNTERMFGMGSGNTDWYFYNPQLIKSGTQAFRRQWGTRVLEDNWRRASKSSTAIFTSDEIEDLDTIGTDSLMADGDSTALVEPVAAPETDIHKPEYYLQQIPRTEADLAISDSLIADAFYNLIYIYKDNLQDTAMALNMTDSLAVRYPEDVRLVDVYYMWYLTALKLEDSEAQTRYRALIVSQYPESTQARIVSDPSYFDRLRQTAYAQDSLYEATYIAYSRSDFKTVKANTAYTEEHYPLTPLMPRFLFLDAVATARTENQDAFIAKLRAMIERYPDHSLSAMAKDFLAMMGQGLESQTGAMTSDLTTLRGQFDTEETVADTTLAFSSDRTQPSVVILALPEADETKLNTLLYEVALFNFSQFLIRDFDLKPMPVFENGAALRVCGLESLDEADWYIGLINKNPELTALIREMNITLIPITEDNAKLLQKGFSVEDYYKSDVFSQKNRKK